MHTPGPVHETVPWAPLVFPMTVRVSPFGSVSLPRTVALPGESSAVVRLSLTVFGAKMSAPPMSRNPNRNVLGVPSVGPSGVLGSPSEYASTPTAFSALIAPVSVAAEP